MKARIQSLIDKIESGRYIPEEVLKEYKAIMDSISLSELSEFYDLYMQLEDLAGTVWVTKYNPESSVTITVTHVAPPRDS